MGCDIHMYAEVLRDGSWHDLGEVDCGRWHGFFARLAGVRWSDDYPEPIAAKRGLPVDCVHIDQNDPPSDRLWNGDTNLWLGEHSFSWCWLFEVLGYKWGDDAKDVRAMFAHITDPPDRVRLVFGFDN